MIHDCMNDSTGKNLGTIFRLCEILEQEAEGPGSLWRWLWIRWGLRRDWPAVPILYWLGSGLSDLNLWPWLDPQLPFFHPTTPPNNIWTSVLILRSLRSTRGPTLFILSYLSHDTIYGEGSLDRMPPPSQKFPPVSYFFHPLYLKPPLSTEFLAVHI